MKSENTNRRTSILAMVLLVSLSVGCGGDAEVAKLINDLKDDQAEERHDAAKALEDLGVRAAPAVPALGRRLNDDDADVRYRAAKALAKIGQAAKVVTFELGAAIANDTDPRVRYYAAKALSEIADQDPEAAAIALDDLTKSLSIDDAKARYYVIKTLGKIGGDAWPAVSEIEKLTGDADKSVREAAASAIRRIKKIHAES